MSHRVFAPAVMLVLSAVVTATSAHAQTVARRNVSADGAQAAIAAALVEARKQQLNVSIAVVDASGYLVAFHRMDAAPFVSVELASGKARTAALFRRPSKAAEELATTRTPFIAIEGLKGSIEGGVPVVVNGEVVGAVGVSGATSAQDASVAAAGSSAVAQR